MKINLLLNSPDDTRSGYLNIDPYAPEGLGIKPHELNSVVDAGEATEIVAHDILDSYGPKDIDTVLSHWISKLAHGGQLILSVVDAIEVARAFRNGALSLDDFNILIHGEQDAPGRTRLASLTMQRLVDVLETKGLAILAKRFENFRAVVTAVRP